MPALHSKQEVTKLSFSVVPPFATAKVWSTTNFTPSCGVLPQYWQVKLSRFKTANRNLTLEYGFFGNLVRFLSAIFLPHSNACGLPFIVGRGRRGILARSNALFHDPKCASYTDTERNFPSLLNKSISVLLGVLPSETKSSCNFNIKKSSLNDFLPVLFPPRIPVVIKPAATIALLQDPKYFSYVLGPGNPIGLLIPFKSQYLGGRPNKLESSISFFMRYSFVNLGCCIGSIKELYHRIIKKSIVIFMGFFDCLEFAIQYRIRR